MPKNRKRKAAEAKAKTQRALRQRSREQQVTAALAAACRLCNAPAGEACAPMRQDDTVLRGVHRNRGQAPTREPGQDPSALPIPPLALEMHHRLGMDGPPKTVYGRPGDPRSAWDASEGVNGLAAAAIAAAEVCEPCLYFYLPELDENESEHFTEWTLAIADRVHSGQDPLQVSHRARAWHRTRHLLDAGTGGFRGPDTPGFAPAASFATLGPEDVQARYGLETWQFVCAVQAGILPPSIGTEAEPRWLTVLIDHDRLDPQFVNRTFGTRMPQDAAATAEYLAARWGVPVEQADVDALEALGHLHPIGLLEGKPVYAPDHLDHLSPGMRSTDADTWYERHRTAAQ